MKFAGFGHVTLTVSKYDECLAFYDRLMKHIGMRKEIRAKIIFPAVPGPFLPGYYSLVCEDPDGIRIEMNYIPDEGWKAVGAAADALMRGEPPPGIRGG